MSAPPATSPRTEAGTRRPALDTRVAAAIFFALAITNLIAGIWLSAQPARAADFETVVDWSHQWITGANPYASPGSVVDYPPWALVVLSPLVWIPTAVRLPFWIATNVGLVAFVAWRLAREGQGAPRARWLVMWLILATSSARTLTQFSLLTEALALAALFSPSRAGAVGVGLSLMKPQIGGAALVWMLLARQWTRAAIAASVPLGLILIFAWHAHANPRALLVQYAHVVASVHGGANPIAGHTELRSWLPAIWPDHGHTQAIATAALAIVLMLPAIVFAARVRTWTPVDRLEMLALCGAVSLLVVRHLSYDFILLWPAIAGAPAAFALLAGALVADLPAWARLAAARGAPALGFLTEIDRVIAVVAWAVLSWRRLARSGGGTIAEGQDLE